MSMSTTYHKEDPENIDRKKKPTFSSQARQSAASSAAQKTIAAALSQASQSVRIARFSHFHCFRQPTNTKKVKVRHKTQHMYLCVYIYNIYYSMSIEREEDRCSPNPCGYDSFVFE